MTEIAIFAAASETFSQRNINQSIAESLETLRGGDARARAIAGMRVRAYLSTAFGCPYEGDVPVAQVVDLSVRLRDIGAYELAISDTIGVAHAGPGAAMSSRRCSRACRSRTLALHFHDTRGTALANVLRGAGVTASRPSTLVGRARRLPVRAGRRRQSRDRGPRLHAARAGHRRRASTWREWSRRRS